MEVQKLVVLVCHAEIHDSENHEDKRLQGDDQNVDCLLYTSDAADDS